MVRSTTGSTRLRRGLARGIAALFMVAATLLADGGLATSSPVEARASRPCGFSVDNHIGFYRNCTDYPVRLKLEYYGEEYTYKCVDGWQTRKLGFVGVDWGMLYDLWVLGRCWG